MLAEPGFGPRNSRNKDPGPAMQEYARRQAAGRLTNGQGKRAGLAAAATTERFWTWLLAFLAACLFAYLLREGWGRRGDVLVDYGREVFLPWQVAGGKVLYRDLTHLFGPVAVYANAALFRLFGPSLAVLTLANATLLLGFSAFLFAALRRLAGSLLAALFLVFFYLLLAFSHVDRLGNFNYLTPYSHELLYGVYLSCLALGLGAWPRARERLAWTGVQGLLAGTVLLLKSEVFLALFAAQLVFLILSALADARPARHLIRRGGAFFLGLALPPALACLYFAGQMPLADFLSGATFMYVAPLKPTPELRAFYGQMSGLLQLRDSLRSWTVSALANGFVLAMPWVFARLYAPPGRTVRFGLFLAAVAGAGLVLGLAAAGYAKTLFYDLPRVWPLLLAGGLGLLLLRYRRAGPDRRRVLASGAACAVFALALSGKNLLSVVFTYYGGFLALPALVLFYLATVRWLPDLASDRPAVRGLSRLPALAVLAIVALYAGQQTLAGYAARSQRLDGPHGTLFARPSPELAAMLEAIRAQAGPGETLAVLPEGAMLNFLSDKASPLRYYNIIPAEWSLFGGDNIVADFTAHEPTWVLMLMRTVREYGHTFLCDSYGRELCAVLARDYRVARTFGTVPLRFGAPGAVLYRRIDDAPAGRTAGP